MLRRSDLLPHQMFSPGVIKAPYHTKGPDKDEVCNRVFSKQREESERERESSRAMILNLFCPYKSHLLVRIAGDHWHEKVIYAYPLKILVPSTYNNSYFQIQ